MKKVWIKKSHSFKQAEEFDQNYYLKMSAKERLEIVQFLRERVSKLKNENGSPGRLRRVIKII